MSLWDILLDLLYPPKCPFCGRVLDRSGEGLCGRCRSELPRVQAGEAAKEVAGCDDCLSALWYRGRVPEAVHRYKFRGGQCHAAGLGRLMAQYFAQSWDRPVDLVTWAPLSQGRLKERGYDQARLLAEQTAKRLGVPAAATLRKCRELPAQSGLSGEADRQANVRDAYRCIPGVDLSGKQVVLVDDVVTTGSTLSECAACLREAGAASIVALTLARARN